MYYNFCGVHQTLRVTPAMESGISNHVRTIEELCGLLAEAASATKRIERELIRKALGMIDKYESRRIRGEIRRVLMTVWDPIGVRNEPNAQDEYDSYLGGVFGLLTGGASDDRINEYLWRIVTERMELPAKKEDMQSTVSALRQIQLPQDSK